MARNRFGTWLETSRKSRKLSQYKLSDATGVDRSHISRIESGSIGLPEDATRAKFHAFFGTSDQQLVAEGILEEVHYGDTVEYHLAEESPAIEEAPRRVHHDIPVPDSDREMMQIMLDTEDITEREAGELLSYLDFIRKRSERR